jgi:beta-fructofuranosidase
MSRVRVLSLRKDKTLGIEPVAALQTLRHNHESVGEQLLPAGREIVLKNIAGNAMEIQAEMDPRDASEICLAVFRFPGKEEYTEIRFRRRRQPTTGPGGQSVTRDAILIDPTRASVHPDVQRRPPEIAPFELPANEPLKLRIFVDRSIVEAFANGRQCLALRVYPRRPDSVGVSISSRGGDAFLRRIDAWRMTSIYAMATD